MHQVLFYGHYLHCLRLSSSQPQKEDTVIILILLIRNLKLREVKRLLQVHTKERSRAWIGKSLACWLPNSSSSIAVFVIFLH